MANTQIVWKTKLKLILSPQIITVPEDAEFIHTGIQDGDITVWFRCTPDIHRAEKRLVICGIGGIAPSKETSRHIGTVMQGEFVWHVFELIK